jgi:hypothetical protein
MLAWEPNLPIPKIENPEPNLAAVRKDKLEPRCTKSNTENEELRRAIP